MRLSLKVTVAGMLGAAACTPTAPDGYVAAPDAVRLGDCENAGKDLEFFAPRAIATFDDKVSASLAPDPPACEASPISMDYIGGAYFYSYVDGTSALTFEGAPPCLKSIYQPPSTLASHCTSDPENHANNHVMHFSGGPFLAWGGGFGVAMEHLNVDAKLCPDSPRPDYCPPNVPNDPVTTLTLDMSQWEGVSFWARRGRNSQALLRVLVGDKFTDDDISYKQDIAEAQGHPQTRYCERVRDCACTYQHLTCDLYPDSVTGVVGGGGYYCGLPGMAPGPAIMSPSPRNNEATNTCNVTRCNDPYAAYPDDMIDPKFYGKPCTPYTFRNGGQSSYCFDPATEKPAQPDQLCGDFWTYPVHLSTDWQFFVVPFNIMYQQGWAKRAPYFDLHSVSVVRFTWDTGNIDYYIDDVRFYRKKR